MLEGKTSLIEIIVKASKILAYASQIQTRKCKPCDKLLEQTYKAEVYEKSIQDEPIDSTASILFEGTENDGLFLLLHALDQFFLG